MPALVLILYSSDHFVLYFFTSKPPRPLKDFVLVVKLPFLHFLGIFGSVIGVDFEIVVFLFMLHFFLLKIASDSSCWFFWFYCHVDDFMSE